jgi:voltage-gated potassium channel
MSFGKFIVKRCYALEDSARYRRVKRFFFDLLENPAARVRPYFDMFMIALVLSSVFLIIYEVKAGLRYFEEVFEWSVVTIFLVEYLLRLWIYNDSHKIIIEHYERSEFLNRSFRLWPALREAAAKKWDYIRSPFAIIDLLAIVPTYRPLRILRFFLLFRLFKLFRYTRSIQEFGKVLSEKRFELYTLLGFLMFIVFTGASAIYFFEAKSAGGQIEHFFDGIYWALVTLSTVGYGDITPQTPEGRVITLVLIICGIGVIAFSTSIIVSAFGEKMKEMRENRVFSELEKRGKHTIICGFGRVGQVVAEKLQAEHDHFVVVDPDLKNVESARKLGYLAIMGNSEEEQLLENIGIRRQAERILCLTDDDVANVYITLTARYLNPEIEIISRANREETVRKLIQVGANHVVTPFKVLGLMAAEYIGQPVAFEAIHGMLYGDEQITLDSIVVSQQSMLDGATIGEIDFQAHKLILFGVITHREGDPRGTGVSYKLKMRDLYFHPADSFLLQGNDLLVVFGHELSIAHFKDCLALETLQMKEGE